MAKKSLIRRVFGLGDAEPLPTKSTAKVKTPRIDRDTAVLEEWLSWLRGKTEYKADRRRRYKEYEAMDEKSIEISSALHMYSADSTAVDWNMKTSVWVESSDRQIQGAITGLFEALDLQTILPSIARNLAKYGDNFERLIFTRDKKGRPIVGGGSNGIVQIRWVNPKYINRVEDRYSRLKGFLDQDPWYVKAIKDMMKKGELDKVYSDARVASKREPWDLAHFRLLGKHRGTKYGTALIEGARRIWKYIDLMTEVLLVTRLSRSPSRKVFYIDVGDSSTDEEAWETVRLWKQMLKKQYWINPITGEFKAHHDPRSPSEDIYWPVRGQKSSSRVEEWPGLTDVREMADIDLLWSRLFTALNIPPAYFGYVLKGGGGYGATINNARTLTMQDIRYARTIKYLQSGVIRGLHRIADVHLSLLGWNKQQFKGKYKIMLTPITTDEEAARNETFSTRLSQAAQWSDLVDRFGANRSEILKHVLLSVLGLQKDVANRMSAPEVQPNQQAQQPEEQQAGNEDKNRTADDRRRRLVEYFMNNPESFIEISKEVAKNIAPDDIIYDDDPLPVDTQDDDDED